MDLTNFRVITEMYALRFIVADDCNKANTQYDNGVKVDLQSTNVL